MSAATTDPALVAAPAPDLSPVDAVDQVGHDLSAVDQIGDHAGASPKERHSLTLDQRRALRRWANIRPANKPIHLTTLSYLVLVCASSGLWAPAY
ncbi:hypothetical protein NXS19_008873 [Fusarium pseudograminearum]|nr:hypothetical protein NXS19_008873 [Fusarium pseudograminearum]